MLQNSLSLFFFWKTHVVRTQTAESLRLCGFGGRMIKGHRLPNWPWTWERECGGSYSLFGNAGGRAGFQEEFGDLLWLPWLPFLSIFLLWTPIGHLVECSLLPSPTLLMVVLTEEGGVDRSKGISHLPQDSLNAQKTLILSFPSDPEFRAQTASSLEAIPRSALAKLWMLRVESSSHLSRSRLSLFMLLAQWRKGQVVFLRFLVEEAIPCYIW